MKTNIKAARTGRSMGRGFTLLEMVIVLGIIALILGAAITFSSGISGTARDTAAEAKIKEIMSKLEAYRVGAGRYPTQQQGLQALVERPTSAPEPKRWKKQFPSLPADPWGNEYEYFNPGRQNKETFEIVSKGSDGQLDTDDDISSQDSE